MDFGLINEQDMIVFTVRTFLENEIYRHETKIEQLGHVPAELGEDEIQRHIIARDLPPLGAL